MNPEVTSSINAASSGGFSVLELFLSSFLGFLSALAVEALWEKHKTKELSKQLKRSLVKELEGVKTTLCSMKDGDIYIQPYSIPVWKGASESGSILCLDNNAHFNDIIGFFSYLSEANLIEMKAYEILNLNSNAKVDVIMNSVVIARKTIKQEIDSIIKKLQE